MTEIWIFCKINIFSETISSGRTYFAIWGIIHYLALSVEFKIMGGSIFKHDGILGGIFPGFMWDPYRITLELSKDPNVIILAS